MQSGRILPIFRQFFTGTVKPGNSNKDSNSQQGQQQAERDATEEEAKRAAELLLSSDEFIKNGILVKVQIQNGRAVLVVTDKSGNALRMIPSQDIVRILQSFGPAVNGGHGRILDRRV